MNPVKVLKPGSRLICLRDLSNKRLRPSSSSSSSSSSQSQLISGEKRAASHSSSSAADAENEDEGAVEAGAGEAGEAEMKLGCLPVVSKSPLPAVTPVGTRPLSLRVVTSTVADGKMSRTAAKRDYEDANEPTAAPPTSRTSSGKTTSTPSPNSLQQMAAAAAADAAGDDATSSGQEDASPSTSPSKQLSKLKRFLKTIHHLGSDISVEIGELVRGLVLKLINNNISIEEFHEKLHKATNFPLRPFVIPFLKSTLPILQQELHDQAELSRLSLHQYLTKNEHLIFHTHERNSTNSPNTTGNVLTVGLPLHEAVNNGVKRRHLDRKHGANCDDLSPVSKRPRTRSSPPLADHPTESGHVRMDSLPFSLGFTGNRPVLLQDTSATRLLSSQLERELIQCDRERYFSNYNCHNRPTFYPDPFDRPDDEWKYVEHLLKCIVGMVDKCQRALVVLQERSVHSRDELTGSRMRRTVDGGLVGPMDIKRYVSDLFSHEFQLTEEQRLEALRNAEESVKDFRLQAVAELQKAVAASEAKAREILAVDRMKMEQTLEEVRRKTRDEVTSLLNKQEDSDENCWNCGRIASQTCSGCNVARYCGAFCQHRHWESHHRVCGRTNIVAATNTTTTTTSSSSSSSAAASSSTTSAPYEALSRSERPSASVDYPGGPRGASSARPDYGGLLTSTQPGLGAPLTGVGLDDGDRWPSTYRSRSRTKSLSPVLLQTTIKQEAL